MECTPINSLLLMTKISAPLMHCGRGGGEQLEKGQLLQNQRQLRFQLQSAKAAIWSSNRSVLRAFTPTLGDGRLPGPRWASPAQRGQPLCPTQFS